MIKSSRGDYYIADIACPSPLRPRPSTHFQSCYFSYAKPFDRLHLSEPIALPLYPTAYPPTFEYSYDCWKLDINNNQVLDHVQNEMPQAKMTTDTVSSFHILRRI
jgi:hypothetical protein